MGVFKAYDIRGIYNKDWDKNLGYKIGFFLPELLKTDKFLVGRDARVSSDEIFEYLTKGLTDNGADVYDIGLATTPMVYFATSFYNFKGSVQITASHNPKEYNGLKISKENSLPVGYDAGLNILEKWIMDKDCDNRINNKLEENRKNNIKGKIYKKEVKHDYLNFLSNYLKDVSNLKIAIDFSNGMASLLVKDLLKNFKSNISYLYDEIDGTFPNHEPNPLIEENVKDLKNLVKQTNADIGVIYDGDADRVMFVDDKGRFISPDLIIGLMGHYFLEKEKGNVLYDIRTSKSVKKYIEDLGGTCHMWKVGHAYAKVKLREINGIYGGELAGHYYFRDFYYCDSGILASLIVLDVVSKLKKENKKLSTIIDKMILYANSGEINFKIENKKEVMEKIKQHFMNNEKVEAFYDFDGYRIEFKDWWFNVRPSNTEPYLRLIIEANNDKILNEKLNIIKKIIEDDK